MNGEKVFFCNYSIGTDTWKEVPSVCKLYGKRILLIGGKKALHAGKERLVQIIYLTEVGTIIIKSEIPLNLWKLFLIFMERTLIAIPLIVLFANLFL